MTALAVLLAFIVGFMLGEWTEHQIGQQDFKMRCYWFDRYLGLAEKLTAKSVREEKSE